MELVQNYLPQRKRYNTIYLTNYLHEHVHRYLNLTPGIEPKIRILELLSIDGLKLLQLFISKY